MKTFNKVSWPVKLGIILWVIALIVNPLTGQFINAGIVWGLQQLVLITDKGFGLAFTYVSAGAILVATIYTIIYGSYRFGQRSRVNVPKKTAKTQKQAYIEA